MFQGVAEALGPPEGLEKRFQQMGSKRSIQGLEGEVS